MYLIPSLTWQKEIFPSWTLKAGTNPHSVWEGTDTFFWWEVRLLPIVTLVRVVWHVDACKMCSGSFCFLKVIPIILPGLSFQEQLNVSLLPSLYLFVHKWLLSGQIGINRNRDYHLISVGYYRWAGALFRSTVSLLTKVSGPNRLEEVNSLELRALRSLRQWFSNWSMPQNYPKSLLKHRWLGPARVSESSGSGAGGWDFVSSPNKFPSDAAAAWTELWNHRSEDQVHTRSQWKTVSHLNSLCMLIDLAATSWGRSRRETDHPAWATLNVSVKLGPFSQVIRTTMISRGNSYSISLVHHKSQRWTLRLVSQELKVPLPSIQSLLLSPGFWISLILLTFPKHFHVCYCFHFP